MLNQNACRKTDELLRRLVDKQLIPGYNMAIVTSDDVFVQTYGWRQTYPEKKPATRETLYDLASLSKVVSTNTCILKLLESGELTLDTTIHSIVPEVINPDYTILDCMTHTTGLPPGIANYKKMSDEEFFHTLYTIKPDPEKAGTIVYSDINFLYLGLVIDRLKGSLKDFARKAVFEPLGMTHTCYQPEDISNVAATEVTEQRGVICGVVHDGTNFRMGGTGGNAGVFSTIDDLIRFTRMMMNDDDPYLSPETRQMLRTCYADKGQDRRTLGWILSTTKSSMGFEFSPHTLYHTGFTGGSILIDLDRKLSFIILCNRVHPSRDNSSILEYRPVLNSIVYDCLEDK
ncbi:MAG: beta-lactamase family protein [Erysipelotrichaceae bacterium]|nr:beta-lactamase family protein [Erysipelotrichaceae bacterium]